MPHDITYSDSGKSARIVVDLDDVSLDSNLNAMSARYVTAQNMLVNHVGPVEKRGAIEDASGNANDLNDQATNASLHFFDGLLNANSSYLPYLGVSDNSGTTEVHMQDDTGAAVETASHANYPLQFGPAPMVDGSLYLMGTSADGVTLGRVAYTYGGSTETSDYVTGTVTVSADSATVEGVGTTTWTDGHVGCYFRVGADSDPYAYRVVEVTDSDTLVLDRPYNGDQAGTLRAYSLSPYAIFYTGNGTVWPNSATIRAKNAFQAWGRMVVSRVRDVDSPTGAGRQERIRWSGLVGSEADGTEPFTGEAAWHANGFWDFPDRGGGVVSMVEHGDAVLVFQDRQLNVMYGNPTYDGIGSLDASTTYNNIGLPQHGAAVSTPYGVFFIDKIQGIMRWGGSGPPQPISETILDKIVSLAPTSIGYYNEHIIVAKAAGTSAYVLHIPTNQWVEWTGAVGLTGFQPGRSDGAATHGDHYLVALLDGVQVVNVAEAIDNPGTQATDSGSGSFTVDLKTGSIGDFGVLLRPRRVHVTYRAEDLSTTNPYLTVTVTTGMPDSSDSFHTQATEVNDLAETSGVETRVLELDGMSADPIVQVQVAQTNNAGKVEIYSLIVDCDVEGQWESD